jgi:hypothetical protein
MKMITWLMFVVGCIICLIIGHLLGEGYERACSASEVQAPFDDGKGKPEPDQNPIGAYQDYISSLSFSLAKVEKERDAAIAEIERMKRGTI